MKQSIISHHSKLTLSPLQNKLLQNTKNKTLFRREPEFIIRSTEHPKVVNNYQVGVNIFTKNLSDIFTEKP